MQNSIEPKKFWQKLLIFWHTRELGQHIETLAKTLSVAIYIDKEFSDDEKSVATDILSKYLADEKEVFYVIEYIEMKLGKYKEDYQNFLNDKNEIIKLIKNDISLLNLIENIIEADKKTSYDEESFLEEIKQKM
ncbi:MAG: hypothetical protein HXX81_04295 [Campylobacterales bacterium]|nr:hypothetical protein [Campylobacterales bacterium]